ncbi:hypothetical protein ACJJTC_004456 [Scirpophaga incertulas]
MFLQCNFCEETSDNIKKYIFHLEVVHKVGSYFICPYKTCKRTYDSKYSFKYHLNSCHISNQSQHGVNTPPVIVGTSINCGPNSVPVYINPFKSDNDQHYVKHALFKKPNIKSCLETFLCNLYAVLNLPRSLVQRIFEMVETLCKCFNSEIDKIINSNAIDNITKFNKIQEITVLISKSFQDFDTEHKRIKHFTRVYSEILNYQQQLLDECFENENQNAIIRNIVQGSLWKEIMSAKHVDDRAIFIPLILYFDDFESGNPLGSHAGQYKLGAVYVSIATIPPDKSSRLENIFLTQLFYTNDRSYFGNDIVFHNIIQELKFLELDGITINVSENTVKIKFVLMAISGDNLGLHAILGFFESFSATNFCRFCFSNKINSQTQIEEIDNLRDPSNYEDDVINKVGIKATCTWNDLPHFHVYKNLSCDVMHDLTEGVHRYDMAHIISGLIEKKVYFS